MKFQPLSTNATINFLLTFTITEILSRANTVEYSKILNNYWYCPSHVLLCCISVDKHTNSISHYFPEEHRPVGSDTQHLPGPQCLLFLEGTRDTLFKMFWFASTHSSSELETRKSRVWNYSRVHLYNKRAASKAVRGTYLYFWRFMPI